MEEYLTPLALAIWIMDDGAKTKSGIIICTDSFTYEECSKLCQLLNNKFSLICTVQKIRSDYRIYISKSSLPILHNTIGNLVIPTMKYKIHLT